MIQDAQPGSTTYFIPAKAGRQADRDPDKIPAFVGMTMGLPLIVIPAEAGIYPYIKAAEDSSPAA